MIELRFFNISKYIIKIFDYKYMLNNNNSELDESK